MIIGGSADRLDQSLSQCHIGSFPLTGELPIEGVFKEVDGSFGVSIFCETGGKTSVTIMDDGSSLEAVL